MPVRLPRRAALAVAVPFVAAAGCIPYTNSYPAVERADVAPLAVRGTDTAWVLTKPPFTVVGRTRATLELPGGLTGVARSWERMFGAAPGAATVVVVEIDPRRRRTAPPPILPDSLATGAVIWVPVAQFDDGDGGRRGGMPVAGTPVMMGGAGGSAALQLAQAWLDARIGGAGNVPIPPWLRAGLVEALGGNEFAMLGGRGRREGLPRFTLDTLLARRCPAEWSPVPRWRPRPAEAPDTAAEPKPEDRKAARARTEESEGGRAIREDLDSPCGMELRLHAGSFVRFLLDRGGDTLANALVRTYLSGGTLEQAIAGQQNLPATTAELERAWQAWEAQRIQDLRMRRG